MDKPVRNAIKRPRAKAPASQDELREGRRESGATSSIAAMDNVPPRPGSRRILLEEVSLSQRAYQDTHRVTRLSIERVPHFGKIEWEPVEDQFLRDVVIRALIAPFATDLNLPPYGESVDGTERERPGVWLVRSSKPYTG